jgi:hypothetical protein
MELGNMIGPFKNKFGVEKYWAHEMCTVWASGESLSENISLSSMDLIIWLLASEVYTDGVELHRVDQAISRGKSLVISMSCLPLHAII